MSFAGFDLMIANLSVSAETLFLVGVVVFGMVFYAKGFNLGIMLHFFMLGVLFIVLYGLDLNFAPTLVCFFISLILMTFSLYSSRQKIAYGGAV